MMQVKEIEIQKIKGNPYQTRLFLEEEPLKLLTKSIRERGLFNPITLLKESPEEYIVIHGHRRLAAFKRLRRKTIPSFIKPRSQKNSLITDLIHENLMREDLGVQEKALSLKLLLSQIKNIKDDLGAICSCIHAVKMYKERGNPKCRRTKTKHTDEDMFMCMKLLKTIGMSENNAISYLTILNLPVKIQGRVAFNISAKDERSHTHISIRAANVLARVKDQEYMYYLLKRALSGTTARHIEGLVHNYVDKVNKGEWEGFKKKNTRVRSDFLGKDHILGLATSCNNLAAKINSWKLVRLMPLSETMDQDAFRASTRMLQKEMRNLSLAIDRIFKDKGWKIVENKKGNEVFEIKAHYSRTKSHFRSTIPMKIIRALNVKDKDVVQAKIVGVRKRKLS